MVYSSRLKKAIGEVRSCFSQHGLGLQRAVSQRQGVEQHGVHNVAPQAPLVLVACSGGRDSLALAALTHVVAGMNGLRDGVIIIDHQLQEGSHRVAEQAADVCRHLGISLVHIETIMISADTCKRDGEESAAREARYQALDSFAERVHAHAICFAHTRDDQAETVLLGAVRNSTPKALSGMPRFSQTETGILHLRPFLHITREDTTSICMDLGLTWWDDPTNGDSVDRQLMHLLPRRSQIRQVVFPALQEVGGSSVRDHLAAFAELQQEDQDFLDRCASEEFVTLCGMHPQVPFDLDVRYLRSMHPALRRRVCEQAIKAALDSCPSVKKTQIEKQVQSLEMLILQDKGAGEVCISRSISAIRHHFVIKMCKNIRHESRRRSQRS